MNILIPIDDEKNLCTLEKNGSWALATLDEGQTKNISFFNSKDEIEDILEAFVFRELHEVLS